MKGDSVLLGPRNMSPFLDPRLMERIKAFEEHHQSAINAIYADEPELKPRCVGESVLDCRVERRFQNAQKLPWQRA